MDAADNAREFALRATIEINKHLAIERTRNPGTGEVRGYYPLTPGERAGIINRLGVNKRPDPTLGGGYFGPQDLWDNQWTRLAITGLADSIDAALRDLEPLTRKPARRRVGEPVAARQR